MDNMDDSPVTVANSFNFFISLFGTGEFSELVITQGADGYQVKLDNEAYLGTVTRDSDDSWKLVNGSIPPYVMSEITDGIDRKLKN